MQLNEVCVGRYVNNVPMLVQQYKSVVVIYLIVSRLKCD